MVEQLQLDKSTFIYYKTIKINEKYLPGEALG